jgi:pyridoxine/pyridoxamine 5'-phosphate oxidase
MNPLQQLQTWLAQEQSNGVTFAHGGVLSTVGTDGRPKSRMLGVHVSNNGSVRFHTSPTSRKVEDIAHCSHASLTLAFQSTLRSVSIEGSLVALEGPELEADWVGLSTDFRRSYLVFGHRTGSSRSPGELEHELLRLPSGAEKQRPSSFVGYAFSPLLRVAYYAVKSELPFAEHEIFERESQDSAWTLRAVVP